MAEDISSGDITSDLIIPKKQVMHAEIVAEETGIICGIEIIRSLYEILGRSIQLKSFYKDGQKARAGDHILSITGNARVILKGERTALNLLQQLSGTATLTQSYVRAVKGTKACIYDTRKTIPGLRSLQKYAVRCGGGRNHRYNLGDAVLIKDNHIACIQGYRGLVKAILVWKKRGKTVEIEIESVSQLPHVIDLPVDIIMLDNMPYPRLKKSVSYIQSKRKGKKPYIEVSGRVMLHNIRRIAQLGVERIAVGAITHSAPILPYTLEWVYVGSKGNHAEKN